jgi:multiple antibiotic resistance protein
MKTFWLCFVPLFFAVDAIGVLPIFINLTEGIDDKSRKKIIIQSMITALGVAFIFLFFGPTLMRLVGISIPDFMIAGGILLLTISLADLTTGSKFLRTVDQDALGAVPIGVPLITGPAVLTTVIILVNSYGIFSTVFSILANVFIAIIVFNFSKPISVFLGNAGTKTLSKIASLFLASIAVMLLRKGVIEIAKTYFGF